MLSGALYAGVVLTRALVRRRVAEAMSHPRELWAALGLQPDGRPAVVAFSSPRCLECAVQARIVEELEAVRVIPVDAAAEPRIARTFGVVTTPSTAVLGPGGGLVALNHGLAAAERLRAQLQPA